MVLACLDGSAQAQSSSDAIDLEAVADHVADTLRRDRVPGAAIAVVMDGETVLVRGFGVDGNGREVDGETRFLLGSMSKAFTALTVMRLAEAGALTLDQPAGAALPELQTGAGSAWQDVTLRHLLTHTSGLPTRTPGPPAGSPLSAYVAAVADAQLDAKPGERHVYSSANYLVAARLLEVETQQPFEALLEEQVLGPLGMQHDGPLAQGHQYWVVWPTAKTLPPDPGRLATASVSASAQEMATFLEFQLGDGTLDGRSLLSSDGMAAMHTGTAQGDGFRYGLGWREADLAGVRTVQHGGVLPNYRGKMVLLPDLAAGVVVLTNASSLLPFPIRATSHRLANEIAIHLAGGPLGLPNLGFRTWLMIYWGGLGLILLHQIVTSFRVAIGRDPVRRPAVSALVDILFAAAIIVAVPLLVGLGWRDIIVQTPDLALWLVTMAALGLAAAAIRFYRLRKA